MGFFPPCREIGLVSGLSAYLFFGRRGRLNPFDWFSPLNPCIRRGRRCRGFQLFSDFGRGKSDIDRLRARIRGGLPFRGRSFSSCRMLNGLGDGFFRRRYDLLHSYILRGLGRRGHWPSTDLLRCEAHVHGLRARIVFFAHRLCGGCRRGRLPRFFLFRLPGRLLGGRGDILGGRPLGRRKFGGRGQILQADGARGEPSRLLPSRGEVGFLGCCHASSEKDRGSKRRGRKTSHHLPYKTLPFHRIQSSTFSAKNNRAGPAFSFALNSSTATARTTSSTCDRK